MPLLDRTTSEVQIQSILFMYNQSNRTALPDMGLALAPILYRMKIKHPPYIYNLSADLALGC